MPRGDITKLKPCTPENARERQLKSAKSRKENTKKKKLMSEIYADFLIKKHKIELEDGSTKTLTGYELCNVAISKIIERGDSASVAIMRELREATEGQKIAVKNAPALNINLSGALLSAADMEQSQEVEICHPEAENVDE